MIDLQLWKDDIIVGEYNPRTQTSQANVDPFKYLASFPRSVDYEYSADPLLMPRSHIDWDTKTTELHESIVPGILRRVEIRKNIKNGVDISNVLQEEHFVNRQKRRVNDV